MNNWASERPGVYSDYDASGILWGQRAGKSIGIAAVGSGEPGRAYQVERLSDAAILFGVDCTLYALCAAAFSNGAARVAAVPVAEDAPDYSAAFAALERENVCAVVCDSLNPAVGQQLLQSVEAASSRKKERVGIAVCGAADPLAWAEKFQSKRMLLLAQYPSEGTPCALAAALSGRIAEAADPSLPLHGAALSGIGGAVPPLSEEQVDAYVRAGICPLETVAGETRLIRAVTSRVKDPQGNPDRTFQELSTVLTMDHVMAAVRDSLEGALKGARNSARTRAALATQAGVVMQQKQSAGLIESYQRPLAYADSEDPAVCVVELSFVIARGLNQIRVAAHVQV